MFVHFRAIEASGFKSLKEGGNGSRSKRFRAKRACRPTRCALRTTSSCGPPACPSRALLGRAW
ncbi:cold-shock protein [Microtetraspora malaysiensis]|uniref:cold-shock protein n=1 Tax=Microtetraspora malaysiensis TaxID=161358 RepID=UPI003D92B0E1